MTIVSHHFSVLKFQVPSGNSIRLSSGRDYSDNVDDNDYDEDDDNDTATNARE